jgi:hypothetical protein
VPFNATSSISQNRLVTPAAIAEVPQRVTNAHGIVQPPPAVPRGSYLLLGEMGLTIVVPDHDGTRLMLCHAEAMVGT